VLAYRDELVSLLKSLDKEGNEGARGFYLTAWSANEGYTFDRIGRGLNLRIDACCLSLLGTTQPAAIGSYLADAVATGGGDGLLSRFGMMVWPDISGTSGSTSSGRGSASLNKVLNATASTSI